jgi:hypothetical protein
VKHQVSQLSKNSKQDYSSAYPNLFISRQQTGTQNNYGLNSSMLSPIQPALNFFYVIPQILKHYILKGFITYLYVQILSWHSVDEAATNIWFISIYFQTNIHNNKATVFFFSIQVFAQYSISTD